MSQVLVARYTTEFVFKVPEGVVLTPENHHVRWNILYITLPDGSEVEIEPCHECEADYKYPNSTEIQPAENWDFLDDE
jgi:hypothetical protein